jgi:hypothetical protein
LAAKAFTPSAVCDEPLIHSGRVAEKEKALTAPKDANKQDPTTQEAATKDDRGDILIRGFWT